MSAPGPGELSVDEKVALLTRNLQEGQTNGDTAHT
jgi:hypothetical protein